MTKFVRKRGKSPKQTERQIRALQEGLGGDNEGFEWQQQRREDREHKCGREEGREIQKIDRRAKEERAEEVIGSL